MKDYKQSLMSDQSDEEEVEQEEELSNDENVDPVVLKNRSAKIPVPNVLPIPAFLVAALMRTYSSNAATLCLAEIQAIKERASRAGDDPIRSEIASQAAYVATWLWNVARRRDRNERLKCVQIGPVSKPRADKWSRTCHLRHLADRAIAVGPPPAADTPEVWTNLANALALQATDRSGTNAAPTTTTKKQGFDAFPMSTERLILVASEREEDEQMRTTPVASYVEVLELANAA